MLTSILPEGARNAGGFARLFFFVIGAIFLYAGLRMLVLRFIGVDLPATA